MRKGILFCVTLFSLSGCSSNSGGYGDDSKGHVHNYTFTTIEATCISDEQKTYRCSCGNQYTEITKKALGHDYVEREQNYKCSRCERYEDDGFVFESETIKGEVVYHITKCLSSSLENGIVTTPRKHLGSKVIALDKGSLYLIRKMAKTLKISQNIKYIGSNLVKR